MRLESERIKTGVGNKGRHRKGILKLFLHLTAVVLLLLGPAPHSRAADAFEQNRKLGRGVNIIGYDPIWRSREKARFKEKHFQLLKQAGFDSVRINLQVFNRLNATNHYEIPAVWLAVADWAVANTHSNGLMAVLDLHEFLPMGTDPEANREKFVATWRQLSTHFQNAPDDVLFEILNEPSQKLTPALWNQYLAEALAIIRETNPRRTVVVGPGFWNSIDHLRELELPVADTNLIVTVHYYKPMSFTHQGAAWAKEFKDKIGIEWPGTETDLEIIKKDFDKAQLWAKEHHRPIYLGEFGAYDKGPMDSRVRWTSSIARAAEARGWSWAYWQFDSDFILYDIPHDQWVEPIRDALAPPGQKNH